MHDCDKAEAMLWGHGFTAPRQERVGASISFIVFVCYRDFRRDDVAKRLSWNRGSQAGRRQSLWNRRYILVGLACFRGLVDRLRSTQLKSWFDASSSQDSEVEAPHFSIHHVRRLARMLITR